MEEETQHADAIVRRILFLEGTPDMRPHPFEYGKTVPEMLRKDLAVEYSVQKNLTDAMALCEKHEDYVSRDMLLLTTARHRRRPHLLVRKAIALDRNARFRKLPAVADLNTGV